MVEEQDEKKVDESWKTQAKREGHVDDGAPGDADAKRPPLPEPSLKTFVSGLAGQVLINLGLYPNPATGERESDLEQAKYSIDLLQILKDKMRGNLTGEEEELFDAMLYDLRMRYVEACR